VNAYTSSFFDIIRTRIWDGMWEKEGVYSVVSDELSPVVSDEHQIVTRGETVPKCSRPGVPWLIITVPKCGGRENIVPDRARPPLPGSSRHSSQGNRCLSGRRPYSFYILFPSFPE